MQEKHYQEYFHSISSSNGNKNTNSGVSLNPEANANLSVNALNHLNPILQNKKPFLTQVKQRAINPDQYKNSKALIMQVNRKKSKKIIKHKKLVINKSEELMLTGKIIYQ